MSTIKRKRDESDVRDESDESDDSYKKNYDDLIKLILNILKEKSYTIELTEDERPFPQNEYGPMYTFILKNLKYPNVVISKVIINIRKDMTYKGKRTRLSRPTWSHIFHIEEVHTNPQHQGIGWATILMIYAMCYVKMKKPTINIFTLDDCSIKNNYIMRNIYNKLGFVFQSLILIDPKHSSKLNFTYQQKLLELKQLELKDKDEEYLFITRAQQRIDEFIEKLNRAGKKTEKQKQKQKNKNKNRKTKTEKQKQKNKNRKTKTEKQKQKNKNRKTKKNKKTKKH